MQAQKRILKGNNIFRKEWEEVVNESGKPYGKRADAYYHRFGLDTKQVGMAMAGIMFPSITSRDPDKICSKTTLPRTGLIWKVSTLWIQW